MSAKSLAIVICLSILAVTPACGDREETGDAPAAVDAKERDRVLHAVDEYYKASRAGDLDRILATMTAEMRAVVGGQLAALGADAREKMSSAYREEMEGLESRLVDVDFDQPSMTGGGRTAKAVVHTVKENTEDEVTFWLRLNRTNSLWQINTIESRNQTEEAERGLREAERGRREGRGGG